jgi:hypothetical protein
VKVVVTGIVDEEMVNIALDTIHYMTPITLIIEAGEAGAGLSARFWAEDHGVPFTTIRSETPVRTAVEVFKLRPDYVLAFEWYNLHLINRAKVRGVQVGLAEVRTPVDPAGSGPSPRDEGDGQDLSPDQPRVGPNREVRLSRRRALRACAEEVEASSCQGIDAGCVQRSSG